MSLIELKSQCNSTPMIDKWRQQREQHQMRKCLPEQCCSPLQHNSVAEFSWVQLHGPPVCHFLPNNNASRPFRIRTAMKWSCPASVFITGNSISQAVSVFYLNVSFWFVQSSPMHSIHHFVNLGPTLAFVTDWSIMLYKNALSNTRLMLG